MSGENQALRRLAGNIVIAVGVLWMLLCGACTSFFLFMVAGDLRKETLADSLPALAMVLIPGAIGIAIGWGLLLLGRALRDRPRA